MTTLTLVRSDAAPPMLDQVRAIAGNDILPIVGEIDRDGVYPETAMRKLGRAGAFAQHVSWGAPSTDSGPGVGAAIDAMSAVGEVCLSTAFCMWCQDALAWYIACSDNDGLKRRLLPEVSTGAVLGGTGLSNPMKRFCDIEPMRLKATRVAGGYRVKGVLPWVSNLGPDHHFGGVFELVDKPGHFVMAIIPCASEGLTLGSNTAFVALDGTRTFSVQMRDVFIPDDLVVADPIDDYLKRIRPGFVLLQAGMAFGLIEGAIALMEQAKTTLHHVNKYLPEQPEQFREKLGAMRAKVAKLSETPFDGSPAFWREVLETRLVAGEATVAAAHAAMLHQGARGYVSTGAAQRRLREAYFVAIVTPATKQLRKMLADMDCASSCGGH